MLVFEKFFLLSVMWRVFIWLFIIFEGLRMLKLVLVCVNFIFCSICRVLLFRILLLCMMLLCLFELQGLRVMLLIRYVFGKVVLILVVVFRQKLLLLQLKVFCLFFLLFGIFGKRMNDCSFNVIQVLIFFRVLFIERWKVLGKEGMVLCMLLFFIRKSGCMRCCGVRWIF